MAMAVPIFTIQNGQTVMVMPDGTSVPVIEDPNATMAQGASPTPTVGDGYAPGATESVQSAPPGDVAPTYSQPVPAQGGQLGQATSVPLQGIPNFRDGSLHPLAGGGPRTPGGIYNQGYGESGDTGYESYRPQVTNPETGASAGPFGVTAPRSAESSGGGYAYGQGGGSGSGSGPSDLYWRVKNKLMGAAGGYGGSSSYGSSSFGSYETPDQKAERMKGKYAKGLDPDQAYGLSYHPQAMIPMVSNMAGGSPAYDLAAALPAYPLSILSKNNWDGSASDTANAVGGFYDDFINKDKLPSTDKMLKNLAGGSKGIDDLFHGVKAPAGSGYEYEYGREPLAAGEAAYTYQGMLDAVLQTTLPAQTAAKYSGYGSYLLNKATAKAMKKPAGKGRSVNEYVGRRLKRQM